MADINGTCDEKFEAVRDALAKNVDSGEELGASILVDLDGHTAVDLWGGFRDEARTTPWDEHTITNVWSVSKHVRVPRHGGVARGRISARRLCQGLKSAADRTRRRPPMRAVLCRCRLRGFPRSSGRGAG